MPLVNGFQMAAGGLGALAGTLPVEAALGVTDWRSVLLAFGILVVLASGCIFLAVPERVEQAQETGFARQQRGVAYVITSPRFWLVAPMMVMSQATAMSIHSLWLGPWLADAAGLERGPSRRAC